MAGMQLPPRLSQYDVLSDYLRVLRAALHQSEPSDVEGEHFRLADAIYRPSSEPAPRIIIGKRGKPRSIAVAAQYADEYNVTFETPDRCRAVVTHVAAACANVGRPAIPVSMLTDYLPGRTKAEVEQGMRRAAATRYPWLLGQRIEQLPSAFLAVTPDGLAARLHEYASAGLSRIVLKVLHPRDLAALDPLLELVQTTYP
jgi:alkanesulfonate monooxygenase